MPILQRLCEWMSATQFTGNWANGSPLTVVPCLWNGATSIHSCGSSAAATRASVSAVMSHRIILTHIPRTGGTSLFSALKAQQPQVKAVEFGSTSEVALMKDSELNSYTLISSYVGSKLFDRLDDSWTKIIILRDPVARLRSSYWNLRTNPTYISGASSMAKAKGFDDYLASRDPAVTLQATNVQTWTVLGDKSIFYRQKHAKVDEGRITAMAIECLEDYDFVGFTETLDEFWAGLCQQFGWKVIRLPKLRVNSPFAMDEDAAAIDLEYHTHLDRRLIQVAKNMPETSSSLVRLR